MRRAIISREICSPRRTPASYCAVTMSVRAGSIDTSIPLALLRNLRNMTDFQPLMGNGNSIVITGQLHPTHLPTPHGERERQVRGADLPEGLRLPTPHGEREPIM